MSSDFDNDQGNKTPETSSMTLKFKHLRAEAARDKTLPSVFESNLAPDDATVQAVGLKKDAIIGGNYCIIGLVGRGGMGEVYKARHQRLNKSCALKVIPPYQVTDDGWHRFRQEALVISRLNHKNIVHVSDLGIHEECLPYYAMEFVGGKSLAEVLETSGRMPLEKTLDIFIQICDGAEYAHKNGIIHRDLKPGNIMLATSNGKTPAVKILDFGLAKLAVPDRAMQSLTVAGEVFGSPLYMSPEQCAGDPIDHRSDIYSVGCTLFECLTGRPPFTSNDTYAITFAQLESPPPTLSSIAGPGIFPDSIEMVIAKSLRKKPGERYQTMAEFRADLDRVKRGEPIPQSSSSTPGSAKSTGSAGPYQPQGDGDSTISGAAKSGWQLRLVAPLLILSLTACVFLAICRVSNNNPSAVLKPIVPAPGTGNSANNNPSILPKSTAPAPGTADSATNNPAIVPKPITPAPGTGESANDTSSLDTAPGQTAGSSADAARMVDAWDCNGFSHFGGRYQALLSATKANFDNGEATYAVGAPDYDLLTIANMDHKTYAVTNLKKWRAEVVKTTPYEIDKVTTAETGIIAGLNCQHYLLNGHLTLSPSTKVVGDYWTTKEVPAATELARACCIFCGTQPGYGMPMKCTLRAIVDRPGAARSLFLGTSSESKSRSGGRPERVLDILTVKKIQVAARTFDMPPKGFRKVTNIMDLYAQDYVDSLVVP